MQHQKNSLPQGKAITTLAFQWEKRNQFSKNLFHDAFDKSFQDLFLESVDGNRANVY